jgi:hypothetical protein
VANISRQVTTACQRPASDTRASVCDIHPRRQLSTQLHKKKTRPGEKPMIFRKKAAQNPDGKKKTES